MGREWQLIRCVFPSETKTKDIIVKEGKFPVLG